MWYPYERSFTLQLTNDLVVSWGIFTALWGDQFNSQFKDSDTIPQRRLLPTT
jgi:hypothetical protein